MWEPSAPFSSFLPLLLRRFFSRRAEVKRENLLFSPFPLLLYPFLEGVAGDPFGPEFWGGRKKELKCGEKWAGEFQMVC